MNSSARIAVIEPDDLIRALVERTLAEAGHRPVVLDTAAALQRGLACDLILADVASPRAAAPLVHTLQAAHAAPLMLMSARFRRGAAGPGALAVQLGVRAVLAKPFSREQLVAAVAAALAP